ncbi:MAG: TlpA family protein disulfide reductase [Bellilinea sp.]
MSETEIKVGKDHPMTFERAPQTSSRSKTRSRNSTGPVVIAVGVLILLISLVTYFRPAQPGDILQPKLNAPISDFELADLDGNWVSLDDYKGSVVLINTWATWCPPCRAEMPDLNNFFNQYRDQGFVVLAINAGEAPATAQAFATEVGLDFPVLVDPDYRVLDALKIDTYPTSILVDRDGIVRGIRVGMHTPETLANEALPLLEE